MASSSLGVGAPVLKEGEQSNSTQMANDKLKRQLLGANFKKVQEREAKTNKEMKFGGSPVENEPKRVKRSNGEKIAKNSRGPQPAASRSARYSDSDDEPGRSSLGKSRSVLQCIWLAMTGC